MSGLWHLIGIIIFKCICWYYISHYIVYNNTILLSLHQRSNQPAFLFFTFLFKFSFNIFSINKYKWMNGYIIGKYYFFCLICHTFRTLCIIRISITNVRISRNSVKKKKLEIKCNGKILLLYSDYGIIVYLYGRYGEDVIETNIEYCNWENNIIFGARLSNDIHDNMTFKYVIWLTDESFDFSSSSRLWTMERRLQQFK